MELIYQHSYPVNDAAVDCHGRLKPSQLLFFCQDIAGDHCTHLGTDYNALAERNLMWAIIRQKVQITRLPRSGEHIRVETWPMPTTKVCYPRSTVAYDREGHELFRAISLWVIMDQESRSMILPGKSGVEVRGHLTGSELAAPGSMSLKGLEKQAKRTVRYADLDRNGHMNNTRYLEWVEDLLPSTFHKDHEAREFTICYHTEALEGEQLELSWQVSDRGQLQVDGVRRLPDGETFQRVFTAQVQY